MLNSKTTVRKVAQSVEKSSGNSQLSAKLVNQSGSASEPKQSNISKSKRSLSAANTVQSVGDKVLKKPPRTRTDLLTGQSASRDPERQNEQSTGTANRSSALKITDQLPSVGQPSAAQPAQPNLKFKTLANHFELYFALGLVAIYAGIYLAGQRYWDERYYIAEEGLGYYLGLSGGIMMLIALCYSLFKYFPKILRFGGLKRWLRLHIFFGIVGPMLILFHSTFNIGSLNGGIALISMTLVFISGVMGRYLYSKTHFGLGGRKAKSSEMREALSLAGRKITSKKLDEFTQAITAETKGFLQACISLATFNWRSRWLYFSIAHQMRLHLNKIAGQKGWDKQLVRANQNQFKKQLKNYFVLLEKVALFKVYERFFSMWQRLHVPLLYLLLISGVIHVIAVHMY